MISLQCLSRFCLLFAQPALPVVCIGRPLLYTVHTRLPVCKPILC